MKAFNKIFAAVLVVIAAVFAGTNLYFHFSGEEEGRSYRVEAGRAAADIAAKGIEKLDLSRYPSLLNVTQWDGKSGADEFFEGDGSDYLLKKIGDSYYRFDYTTDHRFVRNQAVRTVNTALLVMAAAILLVLLFVRVRLIRPFNELQEVPFELSKGNLVMPAKENKNRYFGRFVWGMNLLRENLEEQKRARLDLLRERKTLILSVSHDIKTPLSAIKLYAKALSKNLYDSPEKQKEIAENINAKADEIEEFVSQIIRASREDFLNLEVKNGEFYLSEVIKQIGAYYKEKLELLKIHFYIEDYTDCLLKGDAERTVEVMQNIIENAVKYGDGQRISVSFSDEEDCRLITVANSGCTLPEVEIPHIFDSFWRGSNAESGGGSGLGLYICRQLMNKMNGEIFAETDKEKGEMRVTLVYNKA